MTPSKGAPGAPVRNRREHPHILDRRIEGAVRHLVAAPRVFPRRCLGVEASIVLYGESFRDAVLKTRGGEKGARVHAERDEQVLRHVNHEGLAGGLLHGGAEHRVADVRILVAGTGFVFEGGRFERPEGGIEPIFGGPHQVTREVLRFAGEPAGHGSELENAWSGGPRIGVVDLLEFRHENGDRIPEASLPLVDEPQHRHGGDRLRDRPDAEQMIGPRGNLTLGVREPESAREQHFSADEDPEGAAAASVILDDTADFLRRGRGRLRRGPWRLRTRRWGATAANTPNRSEAASKRPDDNRAGGATDNIAPTTISARVRTYGVHADVPSGSH